LAMVMEWRTMAILAATHIATLLLGPAVAHWGIDDGNAGDAVRLQRRPVDVLATSADEAVTLPEVLIVAAIVVVAFLAYRGRRA
jgi:hypothetical protein